MTDRNVLIIDNREDEVGTIEAYATGYTQEELGDTIPDNVVNASLVGFTTHTNEPVVAVVLNSDDERELLAIISREQFAAAYLAVTGQMDEVEEAIGGSTSID